MGRLNIISFVVVFCSIGVLLSGSATSQGGGVKNLVQLQANTPGFSQSGHINISGTAKAGEFVGGGSGLADVNAYLLDGFSSTAFMKANPVPLTLESNGVDTTLTLTQVDPVTALKITGPVDTSNPAIFIDSTGTTSASRAMRIRSSAGFGLYSEITDDGTAIHGVHSSETGVGVGVFAGTLSPNGVALRATGFSGVGTAFESIGLSKFIGNAEITSGKLSIGAGSNPAFPLDFGFTMGSKIAFAGVNESLQYGIGIQPGVLQIYGASSVSAVAFGYGGSNNFVERARFIDLAHLAFRTQDDDIESKISTPYDFVMLKDRDNDNGGDWFRLMSDAATIENVRVEGGDEAATKFDGAVIGNGIDFAEGFKIFDSSLEPGDLVVNLGSNWECITRSTSPYQNGVIGVISTKPAFVAGMSFDAEDRVDPELTKMRDQARRQGNYKLEKELTERMSQVVAESYRPVAFMGRVPVKVVGPIKAGDHLTASVIPGVAMAMSHAGHSIGIALEGSSGSRDKIMAMIQPGFVVPNIQSGINGTNSDPNHSLWAENATLKRRIVELEGRLERIEQMLENRRQ